MKKQLVFEESFAQETERGDEKNFYDVVTYYDPKDRLVVFKIDAETDVEILFDSEEWQALVEFITQERNAIRNLPKSGGTQVVNNFVQPVEAVPMSLDEDLDDLDFGN